MKVSMESYLREERRAGCLESQGRFTVLEPVLERRSLFMAGVQRCTQFVMGAGFAGLRSKALSREE